MGGFDVALGPIGENFSYGEETHLQKRIREKGYKIGFDPYLQIDHYVAPYKQHMAWFFKSAYQHGYSSWLVYERKVTLGYLLLNLAAIILIPLVYLPKNFYRLVVGREYYWQNFFIDTFRRSSSAFGRIVAGIGNFRSINANVNRIER
jgi:GT2 family glycosyltransferase